MLKIVKFGLAAFCALGSLQAYAQSETEMTALGGLVPVSVLLNTPEGKAALAANLEVTGAIQTGDLKQPILLPFPDQRAQALRDAFITGRNASQLADALGTKLGAAYQKRAHYDGPKQFTNVSQAVADLIAYTGQTTGAASNAGKYFFANETTDGTVPVPPAAAAILAEAGGVTDVFGKAYGHLAGSANADRFGNSRPFQTEPTLALFADLDYFGAPSDNTSYTRGPAQDLRDSPSYPSGHTTYGYTESMLLAILVPERYQQQVARGAEYGNDRIILGAHYAMDVLGGRTLALYELAHLLANDKAYLGRTWKDVPVITDYQAALKSARADLTASLQSDCGDTIAVCATADTSRFKDPAANAALYEATQTYGLPVVYQSMVGKVEDVGKIAPEAGYLLTAAFPYLTLAEADDILTATEGPGGGFLDNGSAFGLYSRIDLYAAAGKAIARAPAK